MATRGNAKAPSSLRWPVTGAADAVAVTVFVLIGRASHHHGYELLGLMQALWPFLAGAAVGWSIVYVYSHVRSSDWFGHDFRPERVLPAGVAIWFCTVTVGMILRYLFHEGVAFSFVIVATVTLGLFLLGWRGVAAYALRRSDSHCPTTGAA
jgi:hypothetical protein